jgi:hypothetical protein
MAFGNRTEALLTAPVFFWLLYRDVGRGEGETRRREDAGKGRRGDAGKGRSGDVG